MNFYIANIELQESGGKPCSFTFDIEAFVFAENKTLALRSIEEFRFDNIISPLIKGVKVLNIRRIESANGERGVSIISGWMLHIGNTPLPFYWNRETLTDEEIIQNTPLFTLRPFMQ